MLRGEVEWHVKNAVEADESIEKLRRESESLRREISSLQRELNQKCEREASLERMIVSEKNTSKRVHDENRRLQQQLEKKESDLNDCASKLTQLKVDNATLLEREKISSFEKTLLESKMAEVDKKMHFSVEDVNKKLDAERRRLERLGLEKLEEVHQRYQNDLERLKKEHNKKLHDTLLTYVSGEDHARLETKHQEALKRAENAERLLLEREELLKRSKVDLENVKEQKNIEIAAERRRREKLNKRLIAQKQSYNDIRQEVETYRKLIESLDLDSEALANTPLGGKRQRTSELSPAASNSTSIKPNESSSNSGQSIRGRQLLLRKVLTPKRTPKRVKQAPPSQVH